MGTSPGMILFRRVIVVFSLYIIFRLLAAFFAWPLALIANRAPGSDLVVGGGSSVLALVFVAALWRYYRSLRPPYQG